MCKGVGGCFQCPISAGTHACLNAVAMVVLPGYCEATVLGEGDCMTEDKGSWALQPADTDTWELARNACERMCSSCTRCRHISFSRSHADCSWFHDCNLAQLSTDVDGFRSADMRHQGKASLNDVPSSSLAPTAPLSACMGAPRLVHWHLRKCGGTTIRNLFHASNVYVEAHTTFRGMLDVERKKGLDPEHNAGKHACVRRLVVLRDPYTQLLSEIDHFPNTFPLEANGRLGVQANHFVW